MNETQSISYQLDALAHQMRGIAAVMEASEHEEIKRHGNELSDAADIARSWAKAIRAEGKEAKP